MICRPLAVVVIVLGTAGLGCGPSVGGGDGDGDDTVSSGSAETSAGENGGPTSSDEGPTSDPQTSSSTGGEDLPPCGCPVTGEFGEQTYPGCAELVSPCDEVRLEQCSSEMLLEDECVATGTLNDNSAFNCLLEGLRDVTPGEYTMVADGFGYFGFIHRLRVHNDGSGVAFHCEWLDLGMSCHTVTVGAVALAEGATTCLMISSEASRIRCAWDLMELPEPIRCE